MTSRWDEPPLMTPSRPQWSDDGSHWWDGTVWWPKDEAGPRQQALAQAQEEAERQRVAAERATWEQQQAEHLARQVADTEGAGLFAPPGSAPPPRRPLDAPPQQAPPSTGYALGVWSLVLGLLGISVPATVLGHLSRKRSREAGLKPFASSRIGLFFGYVGLVVGIGVAALIVWAARGGIDDKTPAGQTLRVAAQVEDEYHRAYGVYGAAALTDRYFRPAQGVTVSIVRMDAGSYCLKAVDRLQTLYLASADRKVTRTSCA